MLRHLILLPLVLLLACQTQPKEVRQAQNMHYELELSVDITRQQLAGELTIILPSQQSDSILILSHGRLNIDSVFGQDVIQYWQEDRQLFIQFTEVPSSQPIHIHYHGMPKRGVSFGHQSVHTHYFTNEWMPCQFQPGQRATFELNIGLPDSLQVIGVGNFQGETSLPDQQKVSSWRLDKAMPAYTYGFSASRFNHAQTKTDSLTLQACSAAYTEEELAEIFTETKQMMAFFTEKSGLSYPFNSYTEVLATDNVSQEMSAFSILRESYGKQVLADSSQVNLSAHELAHQWWGNRITCETWQHFWLNEGMAVFMSSAFIEHRFGREQYLADIQLYRDAWKKVPNHSLVYDDWSKATAKDRVIVYYKGACFLHELRGELGEDIFWRGIKEYSQTFADQSVHSKDFQAMMEKAAKRSLAEVFDAWVW
ncbi:MAG: M1 family aminopeptidase [Bacteroidota bacterium]